MPILTLLPDDPHLGPADVRLELTPAATAVDLARAVTDWYRRPTRHPDTRGGDTRADGRLLAPVDPDGAWPAQLRLTEADLCSGSELRLCWVTPGWASGDAHLRPSAVALVTGARPPADDLRAAPPDLVPLHHRTVLVGRDPAADVTLDDPLVSRRHCLVRLGERPTVVDLGSTNGTQVDGVEVRAETPLGWSQPVRVGDTEVRLEPRPGVTAGAGPRAVLRPPRLEPIPAGRRLRLAPPPEPPGRPMVPWLSATLPLALGGVLWVLTRSLVAVAFTALSPLLFLGAWWEARRDLARDHRRRVERHRRHVGRQIGELLVDQQLEAEHLELDHPDPPGLVTGVLDSARLWSRRRGDPDLLTVRVGRGPRRSTTTVEVEGGGDPDDHDRLAELVEDHAAMADVPVTVDLLRHRSVAVVGPEGATDDLLRAVVLRLAVDHSPTDLRVLGALGEGRAHHLDWLRWLPHAVASGGTDRPTAAVGASGGGELLAALLAGGLDLDRRTVVLVDDGADLPRPMVERLLAATADEPVVVLWVGDDPARTPTSIGAVLDLGRPGTDRGGEPVAPAVLRWADRSEPSAPFLPDELRARSAETAARRLARCVDVTDAGDSRSSLPASLRLPSLIGDLAGPDDVDAVVQRWSETTGLRAPIGLGPEGTVTVDLRRDGPHGLVAGTTGSGKSELLQTLIASLAVSAPPSRLAFLLVDYKGGAAFEQCRDLPHTVGYITDLTPALVGRALTSLRAEITRRERQLDAAGAKSLTDLEAARPGACPPSLLIVVDELAALAADVPRFVEGMVDIAQRGRSLGMHLLLATQRPQGVVTDSIRANTDLRIALRVGAAEDSQDVIGTADAAAISRRTPGRAWVRRVGHGDGGPVQVAHVGIRSSVDEEPPVVVRRHTIRRDPDPERTARSRAGRTGRTGNGASSTPTDLERLVATTVVAARRCGESPGPPPWVKELGASLVGEPLGAGRVALVDHSEPDEPRVVGETTVTDGAVPVGLADEPAAQRQRPLHLDHRRRGSYVVLGASGSGKSELLRWFAVAASLPAGRPAPHLYVVDAAGGGLADLRALPTVGDVVPAEDRPRVLRLIRRLHRAHRERAAAQAHHRARDLDELRRRTPGAWPRTHLLVDGLASLVADLDRAGRTGRHHVELLTELVQQGRRTGIHLTATAPRRAAVDAPLWSALQGRVVLRLASSDEYGAMGLTGPVPADDDPPGRAIVDGLAVQVAAPPALPGAPGDGAGPAADGADRLRRVLAAIGLDPPPAPIPPLPDRIVARPPTGATLATAAPAGTVAPGLVVVGLDHDQLEPAAVDLDDGCFVVAGRSRSGKSGVLAALAGGAGAAAAAPVRVVVGPGAAQLAAAIPGAVAVARPDAWPAARARLDPGTGGAPVPTGGSAGTERAGRRAVLALDDLQDWAGGGPGSEPWAEVVADVEAMLRRRRTLGLLVVAAVDTDHTKSAYGDQLDARLRRDRCGLVLRPDELDGSVLGCDLPAPPEDSRVPARGFLCVRGAVRFVQAFSATATAGVGTVEP